MWLGQPPYDDRARVPGRPANGQPRRPRAPVTIRAVLRPPIGSSIDGTAPYSQATPISSKRSGASPVNKTSKILSSIAAVGLVVGLAPLVGASSGAADAPASVTVVHGIPSVGDVDVCV